MSAIPIVSFDIEDWCQSSWDRSLPISSRAAANAERLLQICDESRVRATFFVLGKFAETFPEFVRRAQACGHEIASHGYGHLEIFKQSRSDFLVDVRKSKQILEDILGQPVLGYRAPDFSVVRGTLWALETLAELGFQYDSSVFPIRKRRYGIAEWPLGPSRLHLANGSTLVEFPIGTLRGFGQNWPVGGGGYHRLLPGSVTRAAVRHILKDRHFVFYCHPYELDASELWETTLPVPLWLRLHQGLGRGRFEGRLRKFLRAFGGRRFVDVLASVEANVSLAELRKRFGGSSEDNARVAQ